jgi:ATP-dependent DNA helicase 2 subunit 1
MSLLQETGEILMPQDMRKSQTFAARSITFDSEEVTQIKSFGAAGCLLFQVLSISIVRLIM